MIRRQPGLGAGQGSAEPELRCGVLLLLQAGECPVRKAVESHCEQTPTGIGCTDVKPVYVGMLGQPADVGKPVAIQDPSK